MASTEHSFARLRHPRGPMAALHQVVAGFGHRIRSKRALRQLSAMSDRDLADAGLHRSMLSRVANEIAMGMRH